MNYFPCPSGYRLVPGATWLNRLLMVSVLAAATVLFGVSFGLLPPTITPLGIAAAVISGVALIAAAVAFWNKPVAVRLRLDTGGSGGAHHLPRERRVAYLIGGTIVAAIAGGYMILAL